jgi:hypothetical protein
MQDRGDEASAILQPCQIQHAREVLQAREIGGNPAFRKECSIDGHNTQEKAP